MKFQYIPYLWLLSISIVILIFLGFFSLRNRKLKGAKAFSICMFNFAFWTVCNALEMAGIDLQTKLFWANMQYFSYSTIHIFWLYMVLQFTGAKKWNRPLRILPLFIIPAVIIMLVWTDQYHGLIRYGFSLDISGSFPVISKSYGPLYWIHPIYGYSIEILSVVLIARAALFSKSIYRMQALALMISPIISIVPSVLYVLSLSPIKGYDITPVFLGVSGIVAAIGLFRYQLFAAVPVARSMAIDNMNAGLIVIDSYGNVADINSNALKLIGKEDREVLGFSAREAMSSFDMDRDYLSGESRWEHRLQPAGVDKELYYEVQRFPILNRLGINAGNAILISDVTELRQARLNLLKQSSQLAAAQERERLARDLHDNLGQVLAFVSMQAQGIRNELGSTDKERLTKDLTKLVDISQSAHGEIRRYISDVRSAQSGDPDFIYEIIQAITEFEERSSKKASVNIHEEDVWNALDSGVKRNVINILKEALANIAKHAPKSENVKLTLYSEGKELLASVQDDGDGFDIFEVKEGSYGLKIMRERAGEIDAALKIYSQPGQGTRIELRILAESVGGEV